MKLNYTIKEVKEEIRELTIPERCIVMVANTEWASRRDLTKLAEEYLKEVGFVELVDSGISNMFKTGESSFVAKFGKESVRVATPSEIVAWNVLNIETLCDSDNLLCDICPLDMIIPVGECCNITTRARNAKQIMDGKEMIVEVVE